MPALPDLVRRWPLPPVTVAFSLGKKTYRLGRPPVLHACLPGIQVLPPPAPIHLATHGQQQSQAVRRLIIIVSILITQSSCRLALLHIIGRNLAVPDDALLTLHFQKDPPPQDPI